MIARTLFLSSAVKLSVKNMQLIISRLDGDRQLQTVPIEDIGYVIIENQMSIVTIPAINALISHNVAVVVCDANHMPSSMLLSLDAHSTQAENFRDQVAATAPLKKSLWQQIIVAKIRNQAELLNRLGKDGTAMRPFWQNVKSGDTDNREGAAAKFYWRTLFGNGFIRNRDAGDINSLLNYGYAILRAAVARAIVGAGLNPSFGLFHRNRYNAFPLADDIMEPYRPFVDEIVYSLHEQGFTHITQEGKAALMHLLYADSRFDDLVRPLGVGLTFTAASLARCFAKEQKHLQLPAFN